MGVFQNAPSEFQNIMNNIFNQYMDFSLVYLDDVLIFSININQHIEHLKKFINIIKENSLVVLEKKSKIFQTKIAKTLFPPDFHYLSIHSQKTQTFYEFVLMDTDSIEILYTQDKQGNIQFSKIKILNILFHQDWNQPLFQQKSFSCSFLPQHYTYYDYMDTWSHTWDFIKVPKMWFIDFGLVPTIFPIDINEAYNYFSEKSSFVLGYHLISSVASQLITWIMT
ncbi:putative enzymatic polyprotein, partial [Mucuna pruriens]